MVALRARMPWSTRIVPRGGRDLSGGSTSDTDKEASGGPTLTQNCWSTPSSFSSGGRGLAGPASGLNRFGAVAMSSAKGDWAGAAAAVHAIAWLTTPAAATSEEGFRPMSGLRGGSSGHCGEV